jgi:pyruvate dehydrogenase E2 component (dihydrolipoamide acetyltransferase)
MDVGTFAGWLKQDGAQVREGDALFVLESDKAAQEIEALDAGILRIGSDAPMPGDEVRVGQVLAYLVVEGEVAPAVGGAAPVVAGARAEPVAGPAARRLARSLGVDLGRVGGSGAGGRITEADVSRHGTTSRARPISSPRARRVAQELGVDWTGLTGSGRNGRIRESDVRAAAGKSDGRLIPHTPIRRTIAARMLAGVTQAAPVTLTTKVHATDLVNLRNQFKVAATSADDIVPSFTDLIMKLTAAALQKHPLLLAQWRDDGLFRPERFDLAFSVDTEAGLLVPVVRGVDRLTLRQVAVQTRQLISLARSRKLTAEQMRDATFTITNLGGLGIDAFTPIIPLPQCAVLGIGRIVREPVVRHDQIVPGDVLTLSLTFDHRILDGAPAARFLQTLGGGIERPGPWLIP